MENIKNKIRTLWYIIKYQRLFKKAFFGSKLIIRCRLKIVGPGKVVIGSNCIFDRDPWGDDYVTLYTHQEDASITIGNNVTIRATCFGSHLSISVCDGATIEHASIFDSDFHNLDATRREEDFNKQDRAVIIGKDCYVGCDCICSKGTVLGNDVILLPFSVIGTKTIPEGIIVGGNPVRPVTKPRPEKIR